MIKMIFHNSALMESDFNSIYALVAIFARIFLVPISEFLTPWSDNWEPINAQAFFLILATFVWNEYIHSINYERFRRPDSLRNITLSISVLALLTVTPSPLVSIGASCCNIAVSLRGLQVNWRNGTFFLNTLFFLVIGLFLISTSLDYLCKDPNVSPFPTQTASTVIGKDLFVAGMESGGNKAPYIPGPKYGAITHKRSKQVYIVGLIWHVLSQTLFEPFWVTKFRTNPRNQHHLKPAWILMGKIISFLATAYNVTSTALGVTYGLTGSTRFVAFLAGSLLAGLAWWYMTCMVIPVLAHELPTEDEQALIAEERWQDYPREIRPDGTPIKPPSEPISTSPTHPETTPKDSPDPSTNSDTEPKRLSWIQRFMRATNPPPRTLRDNRRSSRRD